MAQQIAAFNLLHDYIHLFAIFENLIQRHHIRMAAGECSNSHGKDLLAHARFVVRISCFSRHFHRRRSLKPFPLLHQLHRGEPAFTNGLSAQFPPHKWHHSLLKELPGSELDHTLATLQAVILSKLLRFVVHNNIIAMQHIPIESRRRNRLDRSLQFFQLFFPFTRSPAVMFSWQKRFTLGVSSVLHVPLVRLILGGIRGMHDKLSATEARVGYFKHARRGCVFGAWPVCALKRRRSQRRWIWLAPGGLQEVRQVDNVFRICARRLRVSSKEKPTS
mmetsp:Transcript_10472/g.22147  ORF Transcript_10472/g.22147 Transcript_10472/m.22147 type:complete len:276 (-) Transcript_10472:408-1235(-)